MSRKYITVILHFVEILEEIKHYQEKGYQPADIIPEGHNLFTVVFEKQQSIQDIIKHVTGGELNQEE